MVGILRLSRLSPSTRRVVHAFPRSRGKTGFRPNEWSCCSRYPAGLAGSETTQKVPQSGTFAAECRRDELRRPGPGAVHAVTADDQRHRIARIRRCFDGRVLHPLRVRRTRPRCAGHDQIVHDLPSSSSGLTELTTELTRGDRHHYSHQAGVPSSWTNSDSVVAHLFEAFRRDTFTASR